MATRGKDVPTRQIRLPAPIDAGAMPLEQALWARRSVRAYLPQPLGLEDVGQLLWAAQGITGPGGLRTAPSAGALYPLELYVVAGEVDGLAPGVYHYSPPDHALRLLAAGDNRSALSQAALGQAPVADAPAVIALAAVFERTTAKYGERGEDYVHMEVGAAAQNVYLQATALGLGTVFIGAFDDEAVGRVLRLDEDETILCLMPVGRP